MKQKINYSSFVFLLGIMVILSTGCTKFLDKKSNSNLVVPSTLKDLQSLLDESGIMNLATPSFGESLSDDYYLTQEMYNTFSVQEQSKYRWSVQPYNFENDWSLGYSPVYNANLCLEVLEDIDSTAASNAAAWKNVKGSALFYRAYHFLNLTWIYAKAYDSATYNTDLGIALRMKTDFNVESERATVKETYDQIIMDATAAANYLPNNPQHVLRPSKAAAYALLARAYLSICDYENAHKYADLSLSIKQNLLDYNTVDLFQFPPFAPFNPEVIFHSTMNSKSFLHAVLIASMDTSLFASYDDNDLRKTGFYFPYNGYTFIGTYSGDLTTFFTGLATDEMYLIRAESSARLGDKDAAMDDLNTLMENRWSDAAVFPVFTATDANDALNKILIERRKELTMRGLRWSDLKRLNKEGANITLKRIVGTETFILPPNDSRYAVPLPADIIKNSKLIQN
jgi:starch-binding outer membrane protein, SusD/RagB family